MPVLLVVQDDMVVQLLVAKPNLVIANHVFRVVTQLLEKRKYLWLYVITNVAQANGLLSLVLHPMPNAQITAAKENGPIKQVLVLVITSANYAAAVNTQTKKV